MTSTQLNHNLNGYTKEHNKDHSCVILTAEKQLNGGIHIPRNSNIVLMLNLMTITINLVNYEHLVLH